VLTPPVDIVREADALVVLIGLPGVRASDFRVALIGNRQISVEGNKPYRHPVPRDSLVQRELPNGSFARKIELPLPVDSARRVTTVQSGVLSIRLPLSEGPLPVHWVTGVEEGSQPVI